MMPIQENILSSLLLLTQNVLKNLFYLLVLFGSAVGFGRNLLRVIRHPFKNKIDLLVFAPALGLGVLSILVLLLGAFDLFYSWSAWILIICGWILLLIDLFHNYRAYLQPFKRTSVAKRDWFAVILIVLLILNLLFALFANALVPPSLYDELAYHLAIPSTYIQNHSIVYIPTMLQSNWPLGTEMLYTLSMLIAGETVARLVTWLCLIILSACLIHYGRKWFGNEAGLLSAVIVTSTPMVLSLTGTTMVEIPLALYSTLAIVTTIDWLKTGNIEKFILSALFCGIAATIKLNGPQTALILAGLILVVMTVRKPKNIIQNILFAGFFVFLSLTIVAPWYAKAWLQTGNPIWPFLNGIFGGRDWDPDGTLYLMRYLQSINLAPSIKNWILGFYFISVDKGKYGRFFLGYDYLFILPFTITALFALKSTSQRQIARWLAILSLAFYTAWFFQTQQTRFLMPWIPLLALLCTAGIAWLWQIRNQWFRGFIRLIIIISLLLSSWMANPRKRNTLADNWPYLTNQITREQYYFNHFIGYPVYAYANENLPSDATVWLAVWESRGYLLERNYIWANPFGQRVLKLELIKNPDELLINLQKLGITYIILYTGNLYRPPYQHNQKITELTIATLSQHARLMFRNGPLELYQLLP
jgi:4-amino-4-deoxy-L-arabinose transferase-like glycosyltransferase